MGEIMKSNREEKTSTLNQGRPPHSEASPQQRLLLPTIQASGRRSPPPRVAPRLLLKYNIRAVRALGSAWSDLAGLDEVVEG